MLLIDWTVALSDCDCPCRCDMDLNEWTCWGNHCALGCEPNMLWLLLHACEVPTVPICWFDDDGSCSCGVSLVSTTGWDGNKPKLLLVEDEALRLLRLCAGTIPWGCCCWIPVKAAVEAAAAWFESRWLLLWSPPELSMIVDWGEKYLDFAIISILYEINNNTRKLA